MDSIKPGALVEAANRPKGPVTITVCTSCRAAGIEREDAPGRALYENMREAAQGLEVIIRPTQCLSVCKRVCTISYTAEGGYTYLFGDLDPEADITDILAMAGKIAEAEFGFVPWKERPEAIRKGILARVPPPGWSPEDGSAPA